MANLKRAPQVAFSVHENALSVGLGVDPRAGPRSKKARPPPTTILEEIRQISARYLPPDEIDAYIDAWPQTRSIVTIHAEAVFAAQAFEDPVAHRRP